MIFGTSTANARYIWNHATKKAGLDEKDKTTNRRIIHLHSLRKYFSTYSGLEDCIVKALMGHMSGLDQAYKRYKEEDVAEKYKDIMDNLSVYGRTPNADRLKSVEEENAKLREQVARLGQQVNSVERLERNAAELEKEIKSIKDKLY